MSKTKGLPFKMRQHIKRTQKNDTTRKVYKRHAMRFCGFVKAQGYTANEVWSDPLPVLQAYADSMVAEKLSTDTIHTYLCIPCGFFGVKMNEVDKPRRSAAGITRSRGEGNEQGRHEAELAQNTRLTELQRRVGIRRSELARLNGTNWKQDENGHWCVEVIKGKGGKYQLQRILPQNVEFVRAYFDGTAKRVFSPDEMNNKIDLHAMRGASAREAYEHYLAQCADPAGRAQLQQELVNRYSRYNKSYRHSGGNPAQLVAFEDEMQGEYRLRGSTVAVAKAKGRPLVYDKTALMAVSVFHLSHWRCDVTVRNYMLA